MPLSSSFPFLSCPLQFSGHFSSFFGPVIYTGISRVEEISKQFLYPLLSSSDICTDLSAKLEDTTKERRALNLNVWVVKTPEIVVVVVDATDSLRIFRFILRYERLRLGLRRHNALTDRVSFGRINEKVVSGKSRKRAGKQAEMSNVL